MMFCKNIWENREHLIFKNSNKNPHQQNAVATDIDVATFLDYQEKMI